MSLVRYDSRTSMDLIREGDEKQLTVVYKNNESNEIVLYDSATNEFEVVKLDDYFQPSNNQPNNSSDGVEDTHSNLNNGYICSHCGMFNEIDQLNVDDHQHHHHHQRRNRDTDDFYKQPFSFSSMADNEKFARATPKTFMRTDYFRLLTNSVSKNQLNQRELTDGDQHYQFHKIPEVLINQGYFNKFFKVLSELGKGSFGAVYKVEHELLGLNLGVFALKKIAIGDDVNNLRKILGEVKFLYDLSCNLSDNFNNATYSNNVVKYNHVWVEVDQVSTFGPKVPVVFLLFEYCAGGTLEDWVHKLTNPKLSLFEQKILRRKKKSIHSKIKPRLLNNLEIFKVFKDITQGLNYLHDMNILHRDLKPSNCLFRNTFPENYIPITKLEDLDKIPTLLVSDFGESIMVNSLEESWQNDQSTGNTGTIEYVAPEVILKRKQKEKLPQFGGFSYSSDIYSLGMLLYYLCFGKLPFIHDSKEGISEEILNEGLFDNLYDLRGNEDGFLYDWIELIEALVVKNPDDRPLTNEILGVLDKIYHKLQQIENENLKQPEDIATDQDIVAKGINGINYNYHHINMIIMGVVNIFIFKSLDLLIFTNLQFLLLGLYFGDSRFSNYTYQIGVFSSITLMLYYIITLWIHK